MYMKYGKELKYIDCSYINLSANGFGRQYIIKQLPHNPGTVSKKSRSQVDPDMLEQPS